MSDISSRRFETLIVERRDDLLWVTLDLPRKANALAPEMADELFAVYRAPLRADGIRALLLRAAGKHFSAGADLKHLRRLQSASEEENRADSHRLRRLFDPIGPILPHELNRHAGDTRCRCRKQGQRRSSDRRSGEPGALLRIRGGARRQGGGDERNRGAAESTSPQIPQSDPLRASCHASGSLRNRSDAEATG